METKEIQTTVITNDITVFGKQVPTFPNGIEESFKNLMKTLPDGKNRSYYGISYLKEGKMAYFATAEEKYSGESKQYDFQKLVIPKGNYLATTLYGWVPKAHQIKNQFEMLVQDPDANTESPAIEWYKNDNEMMCLLRKKD